MHIEEKCCKIDIGLFFLTIPASGRVKSGGNMDRSNRPLGREKNVTGGGAGVHRRGSGLGTGPVGGSSAFGGGNNGGPKRSGGGRGIGGIGLIGVIIMLLLGRGGGFFGGLQ